MGAEAQKVLASGLALPDDQRRRVAEALLESIPKESAKKIETAWIDEAICRADELERGVAT